MKKILTLILALMFVLSLAGCGGKNADVKAPVELKDVEDRDLSKYTEYDYTLEGLCEYMADLGYAYEFEDGETGDESVDPVYMSASMIGAERGYKFSYTYDGKEGSLELYYYTDKDNQWYKQIKEDGKLTVSESLEGGTVDAVLAENGDFVMIQSYKGKGEDRINAVKEAFLAFYPEGATPSEPASETQTEASSEPVSETVSETAAETLTETVPLSE